MLLFQLTTILLSSNVYAADPDESLYNAAMSSITDGSYYITTNVKGVKFYVTTDGRLSNVKVDGGLFAISKSYGGQLYDIGILIDPGTGSHFTNTSLDVNNAVLHPGFFYLTSSHNRNDWERQVFYMNKEGKFAIRSCNTAYGESGWNDAGRTFWNWEIDDTNPYILDVFPCYSYEPAYVWILEGDGNGEEEPSGGISFAADDGKEGFDGEGVDKLFDGDTSTKWCTISDYSPIYAIFHSSAPIFVTGYKITTTNDSDWYPERNPKSWTLYGSTASSVPGKDDSSWEVIATVTNDTVLQAANFTTYTYSLPATTNKAYKNFKWVITAAGDDSGMIQVSEFRLTYTTESGGETDDNITFADANVKALCVANWDTNGDGELSKAEAAAVTKLGKVFYANRNIRTFDELRYFISLNSIEEQAFFSCSNLTSVIIPMGVTSIEDNAFAYCNITSLSILGPVESIGSYAFFCCWNLASLTIPSSVTNVKLDAFAACDGLTSIVVDSGNPVYDSRNNCNAVVRTLDNTIVLGCKTTTIPTSVTTIGVSAFSSIPELFTIKIPDNIIKICEFAFSNCDSLKTVELGIGVVEIERWAFRECKSLKDFYCNATTPPATGDYVFGNNPKVNTTATLHVPSSALSTYKSTTPWSEFRNIVSMDEEPTEIDPLLVGVWKMYFGTNDYVLLTFSQDGKVRYQEYDGGVWQHDEAYSFIYSNGTLKIIDNNGNEKGTIEVITLTSTTLELRNWPDRGVNTFTKQNGNEEESAIINGSIVGQWNMVSGSYKRYENDVLVSEENGNLSSPYHRIVFYDNGTLEFLEYSTSSNSYHEDGKGTYTIKDKKFVYGGGDWDKFVITSFDGADNMEVFFQFSEDKISTIVRKVYSVKLQRVSGGGDTPSQSDVEIDGIHYTLNGSYAEVQSKKEKYRGEVIIPASVSYSGKTYSVTSIGDAAFYDCENLNSVVIPTSVRKIGNNAFYGCKLRNVLIKCQTPPTIVGTYLFSDQTFYHTTLYIPSGTWDVYAYDDVWYKFINIRESATSGNQLSDQQVYTMMDANTFAYSVYDPVNDCISSISSVGGIDENNPNHNWQLIDADGGHYLYNIGARKFVVRTRSIIGYALSDMPEPIEINDGDKGIILGNNKASQWVLVSNNRLNVDESVTDEVTGLIKLYSNQQADRNIYNLNGQRLSSPQKGLNIINGHKVLIK